MAENDPADAPYWTGMMHDLLYKATITRKELECLPKWNKKALAGTLYRWDETRAIMMEEPGKYRFLLLED